VVKGQHTKSTTAVAAVAGSNTCVSDGSVVCVTGTVCGTVLLLCAAVGFYKSSATQLQQWLFLLRPYCLNCGETVPLHSCAHCFSMATPYLQTHVTERVQ
jgi:hypothetical protein